MLDSIFSGGLTMPLLLLCIAASLILGMGTALVFMFRNTYTQSFVVTLALLPAIVSLVIMMVNGNIGAGVAVAGTFSLVRFRSVPGGAREIGGIFLAMALGLAVGMGYLVAAAVFFVILGGAMLLLSAVNFGAEKRTERELKITIPESLDYEGLFDDILAQHTDSARLVRVKTSNMGTLYELSYHITLKGGEVGKDFLDQLRCRNGNLTIVYGRRSTGETL